MSEREKTEESKQNEWYKKYPIGDLNLQDSEDIWRGAYHHILDQFSKMLEEERKQKIEALIPQIDSCILDVQAHFDSKEEFYLDQRSGVYGGRDAITDPREMQELKYDIFKIRNDMDNIKNFKKYLEKLLDS